METTTETLNPYILASVAEVSPPDNATSPGAEFLISVARAVEDARAEGLTSDELEDRVHEIANDAPSIYTYPMFQQFTDLAAWQEDLSGWGELTGMEEGARLCLFQIAHRLGSALLLEEEEED